jgi:hypothetical protein
VAVDAEATAAKIAAPNEFGKRCKASARLATNSEPCSSIEAFAK